VTLSVPSRATPTLVMGGTDGMPTVYRGTKAALTAQALLKTA